MIAESVDFGAPDEASQPAPFSFRLSSPHFRLWSSYFRLSRQSVAVDTSRFRFWGIAASDGADTRPESREFRVGGGRFFGFAGAPGASADPHRDFGRLAS